MNVFSLPRAKMESLRIWTRRRVVVAPQIAILASMNILAPRVRAIFTSSHSLTLLHRTCIAAPAVSSGTSLRLKLTNAQVVKMRLTIVINVQIRRHAKNVIFLKAIIAYPMEVVHSVMSRTTSS